MLVTPFTALRLVAEGPSGPEADHQAVDLCVAISGAEQTIRATSLDRASAELLQVAAKAPALEVRAVGFLQAGAPLWWERTLYRGDAYAFHTRLGPMAGW